MEVEVEMGVGVLTDALRALRRVSLKNGEKFGLPGLGTGLGLIRD